MRLGKICELLRLSSDTDQVSKHVRSWHKETCSMHWRMSAFWGQSEQH